MKNHSAGAFLALALLVAGILPASAADPAGLTCVGVYSETSAGSVSWRTGSAAWTAVKVGDVLPASAEIRINVDRDWVEFVQNGKPGAVYEIPGPPSGEKILKAADILKLKPRAVAFPKGAAGKPDAAYKDKLTVVEYLGRQIFLTADGDSRDIKYGDVLDAKGKVKIIAINNTITLMNAEGAVVKVIGPLTFTIADVLGNKNLYKFLNVQK